jgi:DNA-binding NarL/FixJ family response regulator
MFNVLVVDPDTLVTTQLRQSIQKPTYVETQRRFDAAKRRLATAPFDFLVTNLRLAEFNGLHLVYLNAAASNPVRSIVYTSERDPWLAREVQRAGAFYETLECLPVTLAAYLTRTLPPSDRRDISHLDRRNEVRGGRRCWDRHVYHASV